MLAGGGGRNHLRVVNVKTHIEITVCVHEAVVIYIHFKACFHIILVGLQEAKHKRRIRPQETCAGHKRFESAIATVQKK